MDDLIRDEQRGLGSPVNQPARKSFKSIETNFTDHEQLSDQDINSFETGD